MARSPGDRRGAPAREMCALVRAKCARALRAKIGAAPVRARFRGGSRGPLKLPPSCAHTDPRLGSGWGPGRDFRVKLWVPTLLLGSSCSGVAFRVRRSEPRL